jgi:hypothetical protein
MNAKEIVLEFESAVEKKDYATARRLLADDVSFRGPVDSFSDADAYVAALARLGGMLERVEIQRVFVDGEDVALFCELVLTAPLPTSFVARWYRVREGKIRSARVVFDARPFAPASPART